MFLFLQFIDLCILLGCDYCDSVKGKEITVTTFCMPSLYIRTAQQGLKDAILIRIGTCLCVFIFHRSWTSKGCQFDTKTQKHRRHHETQLSECGLSLWLFTQVLHMSCLCHPFNRPVNTLVLVLQPCT